MDYSFAYAFNLAGSIAFAAGVVFAVVELFKKGLSKRSLAAYICFAAGIILLADSVIGLVIPLAVLTLLFLLLLYLWRKRPSENDNYGDDDENMPSV